MYVHTLAGSRDTPSHIGPSDQPAYRCEFSLSSATVLEGTLLQDTLCFADTSCLLTLVQSSLCTKKVQKTRFSVK